MPNLELVIALPKPADELTPPTHIRGTVLSTSFDLVRQHGKEARYLGLMPSEHHDTIRFVVPQSWVPLDIALAHFCAMQEVFPDARQQVQNGREASERTQNNWLKTVVRALVASGHSPAMGVLKRIPAAFDRFLRDGGGVAVYEAGPKDGRLELYAQPLVATPYIRNGWQGMLEAAVSLASRSCVVRQDPRFQTTDRMAFDVSWV